MLTSWLMIILGEIFPYDHHVFVKIFIAKFS